MSDRRSEGALRERAYESWHGVPRDVGGLLPEVARRGFVLARGALSDDDRCRLVAEAEAVRPRFLRMPRTVNGVRQRGDQLTIRVGDPGYPCVAALASTLCSALRSVPDDFGVHRFRPTEARFMRYPSPSGGLGAHRDGTCYGLVVAVFSLAGSAVFTVFPERGEADGSTVELRLEPGDLVLLRAPGFQGQLDGRPRHAVGPPLEGDRLSLTLRMVGRHGGARALLWSRAG